MAITIAVMETPCTQAKLAATFNGGGFRAHAVHTGVIAGLLGHDDEDEDASPSPDQSSKLQELFADVDQLGSNSGGSWFLAQLAYSNNFVDLVYNISETTSVADGAALFDDKWIKPFLSFMAKAQAAHNSRRLLVDESLGNWIKTLLELLGKLMGMSDDIMDWLDVIMFTLQNDFSWMSFVEQILELPGDLDASESLAAAKHNSWCAGKGLAIAAAAGATTEMDNFMGFAQNTVDGSIRSLAYVSSVKSPNAPVQPHIPTTFGVRLGKKGGKKSELPFTVTDASFAAEYRLLDKPTTFSTGKVLKTVAAAHTESRMEDLASQKASIRGAVASSSAFLGSVSQLGVFGLIVQQLNTELWDRLLNLATYFSLSKTSYERANEIRANSGKVTGDKWVNQASKAGMLTLADGGLVDNTAVAQLVTAGVHDVVVFVSTESTDSWGGLGTLFQGAKPADIFTYAPIFEAKADDALANLTSAMSSLELDSGLEFVQGIRFGTLEATTAAQPLYGLQAGERVRLHVVQTAASIGLASSNWHNFATVVGEINAQFHRPANAAKVASLKSLLTQ
ncbi:Uncharacterized protein SCF082_LOCUS2436 [Durusdinium trenchii]|uniref:Phospholipase B-like n=1 Tax=Durusdinium trenchii TaxID=1381693 RepID=A0ABP0HL22_9DINO